MRLSAREAEVLGLALEGMGNTEIARRLGCECKTVESHLDHILTKATPNCEARHGLRTIVALLLREGFLMWAQPLVIYRVSGADEEEASCALPA